MSDAKPAEIAPASIVEIDDVDEGDSSFGGDDSDSAISASITSSILNYEYTNGRRYTGYRRGEYLLPNDETEQDRLDLLHHVFLLLNDGKLLRSPISPNPQRALDIGTGTGIWALDFADQYQSAQVIGLDLSPIQPSWVPPNLKFYIDDVEKEWAYGPDDAFDVIHARQMGGSIGNWEKLAKSCFDHMKPGGWIELQEPQTLITSDDDTSSKATATNEFLSLSNKAAEQFGKELNMAPKYKQYLLDAGFVDVKDEVFKTPIGPWAKDPKLKEVGRYFLEHCLLGVDAYILGFIGKVLGWTEAECMVLAAKVKAELRDRKNHLYLSTHFVYGRKPT
ncbi:hypothetical protein GX50_05116 [[Emmonsia] crescens]|uniref:Methyltransferase n=1 Tax=[Emmonsia] crescens TaxID=73230 RepID=A0A2B7ZFH9_9EURO|nr:hypothetical protein GX50_05116 [Emmonsia crescens]